MKRVIVIVLDSLGVGDLPDAAEYGGTGANTLGHIAENTDLRLPNLQKMGLGNIIPLRGIEQVADPTASWGKMASRSFGKDTTTGHWEIAGIILDHPLPVFPNGFPDEIIIPFCREIGRNILGNKVASGTAIIQELGAEHIKTGYPIVYTSADSVFQVAAHEEMIPLPLLYQMCETARNILTGKNGVGRVIARPFTGQPGNFKRTENRKDFSLLPPAGGLLERITEYGNNVVAIGKITDIFAGQGISRSLAAHSNQESISQLKVSLNNDENGLIFANLVDFDMLYGHRNDVYGYQHALEEFDSALPALLSLLHDDDLLFITADHGNDPTSISTDHNREYVPILAYRKSTPGRYLGIRSTFADLGATVAEYLGIGKLLCGDSFLPILISSDKG